MSLAACRRAMLRARALPGVSLALVLLAHRLAAIRAR